ncbi:electron transfer flavoprotein subunit beta/FixA family protein [Anaerolineales bacterium HSG24]|nr:electron transfer flavoprotein subunit beta/FixA family protein [Anaerolineales bacterium HSG24]
MKIVVLVKQTPDTAKLSKRMDGLQLSADGGPRIVNPWDEYAIEAGLVLAEKNKGSKVTALCLGKPEATEALKRAIAMGANDAVLISDSVLAQADSLVTAKVLAAAIKKIGEVDLVLAGRSSIDGNNAATAVQIAALLDMSMLSYVASIEAVEEGSITAVRAVEAGRETVSDNLPAVISVVREINEPRYPSFMKIRKATKAKIPIWGVADLGLSDGDVVPQVLWEMALPPSRNAKIDLINGTPVEAAKLLADKLMSEKVI